MLSRRAHERPDVLLDRRRARLGLGVGDAETAAEIPDGEPAGRVGLRSELCELCHLAAKGLQLEQLRADMGVQTGEREPVDAIDPLDRRPRIVHREAELGVRLAR